MTQTTEPKLDAPGAGLPAPMLFAAKRLFALKCKTGNRDAFINGFRKERVQIGSLLDPLTSKQRAQRVLVPRLRGLEDSSRFYSVWMTLDHLRITNNVFARFIKELSEGQVPDIVASTANVKPDPKVTEDVIAEYEKSCDDLLTVIDSVGELKTPVKFSHPWFGPLNAFEWLALSSMHMGIHRNQIKAIIARLPR